MSPLGGYDVTLPDGTVKVAQRVTHVIRHGIPSPGLEEWKLRELAEWIGNNLEFGEPITSRQLVAMWRTSSRGAADRGTRIHRWIAATLTESDVPVLNRSEQPYADAFCKWMADDMPYGCEVAVEQPRTTAAGIVAGTADAIFTRELTVALFDWKTCQTHRSDHPFPEAVAQIGAYTILGHQLEVERTHPMPTFGAVVYLAADGTFRTHVITLLEAVELWESARTVARWTMNDLEPARQRHLHIKGEE